MDIYEAFKATILQVNSSIRNSEILIGEVTSLSPFEISLGDKFTIDSNVIIWSFRSKQADFIYSIGTKFLIISETGGQRFFIIDIILDS